MSAPVNTPAAGGDAGGSSQAGLQARAEKLQAENMAFQMMMLELQNKMSQADRAFQTASAMIEKGDKAAEKVGDRMAN